MQQPLVQSASGLLLLDWSMCATPRACIGMVSQGLDNFLQLQHQHHSVLVVTAILRERAAEACASKRTSNSHNALSREVPQELQHHA